MIEDINSYIRNALKNTLRKTNDSITEVNVRIKTLQQGIKRNVTPELNVDLSIELGNQWAILARLMKGRTYFERYIEELDGKKTTEAE